MYVLYNKKNFIYYALQKSERNLEYQNNISDYFFKDL